MPKSFEILLNWRDTDAHRAKSPSAKFEKTIDKSSSGRFSNEQEASLRVFAFALHSTGELSGVLQQQKLYLCI